MTTAKTEFGQRISESFTSCLPNLSGVLSEYDFTHTLANRPFSPSKLAEIINVLPNPNLDNDAKAILAMLLAFEHGFEKICMKASENELAYNEERSRNVRARNACTATENEKDVLRAQLEVERVTLTRSRVDLADSLEKKLVAETQLQISILQNARNHASGESTAARAQAARRTQKDPNKFTALMNEKNPVQRQEKYDTFKTQVQGVILVDSACFPTEASKIIYICGLMDGHAWDAVCDGHKSITASLNDPSQWQWKNENALLEDLDSRYILFNSATLARNMLDNYFQDSPRNSTRPHGEWKADFIRLSNCAKLGPREKVDKWRRFIGVDIKRILRSQVDNPGDEDFAGWVARCDNIARNQLQEAHYDLINHSSSLSKSAKFNEPAKYTSDIPIAASGSNLLDDPMDISRLQISDSERQRRRSQGLCLACGQSGHIARDHHRKFNPIPMPKHANITSTYNRQNCQDIDVIIDEHWRCRL